MPASGSKRRQRAEAAEAAAAASAPEAAYTDTFTPTALTQPTQTLETLGRTFTPLAQLAALWAFLPSLYGNTRRTDSGVVIEKSPDNDGRVLVALGVLLLLTAASQMLSCVLCMAPAGAKADTKADRKRKAKGPNYIVVTVLSTLLTAASVFAVHAVLVLFGAPLLDQSARTLLCAAHFGFVALYPVIFTRGTDALSSVYAIATATQLRTQLDHAVGGFYGAAVGAWLGAVPIPLDWDRAWQRWPLTVLLGMYAGACVGRIVGGQLQAAWWPKVSPKASPKTSPKTSPKDDKAADADVKKTK